MQQTTRRMSGSPRNNGNALKISQERIFSLNRSIVNPVMEVPYLGEWPSTEAAIRVARASLFTAQAIVRDLNAAGKEKDVQSIREFISTIVPEPNTDSD